MNFSYQGNFDIGMHGIYKWRGKHCCSYRIKMDSL